MTMACGYSRWRGALLIPSRSEEDLYAAAPAAANYVGFAPHNPRWAAKHGRDSSARGDLTYFSYLKIMATDVPWRPEITNERLVLTTEGDILIPTGEGLGIELDLEAIALHPFTPHPVRMFHDAVYDIRPGDERSFFNLGDGA